MPFELGRPLGTPDHPEFQRKVLSALLALLDSAEPVVKFFEQEAENSSSTLEGWACPVTFSPDSAENSLTQEVTLLKPWFEKAKTKRGRSATGTSGLDIDAICILLEHMASEEISAVPSAIVLPEYSQTLAFGDLFKLAVEDLKMFFAEAALAQPNPGTSKQLQDWFWEETSAGKLVFELAVGAYNHPDKLLRNHARFTLVPAARFAAQRAELERK